MRVDSDFHGHLYTSLAFMTTSEHVRQTAIEIFRLIHLDLNA